MKQIHFIILSVCLTALTHHSAIFAQQLPYPINKSLTGLEIAEQAHFVMRAQLPNTAASKKYKGEISRLINRRKGKKASVNTFESFINNNDPNEAIKQKQLFIFRSGKLKGTGLLLTQYSAHTRKPLLQIWLPKLRKVKRINAPDPEEYWLGSNLTYGEVFLRTINDEKHELINQQVFNACLMTMVLPKSEQSNKTKKLPLAQCKHKDKLVYKIKSSTHLKNHWYDYHLSFIDSHSFALYRTHYFKNNQLIKTIDIDWHSAELEDPRAVYPLYLYSKSLLNQSETLLIIPKETISWNKKIRPSFWSEASLRKIKR